MELHTVKRLSAVIEISALAECHLTNQISGIVYISTAALLLIHQPHRKKSCLD